MRRFSFSDGLLIAGFLAVIFLPMADHPFHLDRSTRIEERRKLADRPVWEGRDKLPAFLTGVSAYADDHFGFRNRLIRWYRKGRRAAFGPDRLGTNDVIVGRDGWLFYSGANMIDSHRRTNPFTEHDLEQWRTALQRRDDWLARQGIRYLVVIVPNKETVYPDKLPAWMNRVGPESRKDQLLRVLREKSTVEVLDLEPVLRRHRDEEPLYWKTDSHWNDAGAYLAYAAIMDRLSVWYPALRPEPPSAFDVSTQPWWGDLARMMGGDSQKESGKAFRRKAGAGFEEAALPPLDGSESMSAAIPPAAYQGRGRGPRVLVMRDSFMKALIPFVAPHFGRSLFLYSVSLEGSVVRHEKPDIVIQQFLERFLVTTRTGDLATRDRLPD